MCRSSHSSKFQTIFDKTKFTWTLKTKLKLHVYVLFSPELNWIRKNCCRETKELSIEWILLYFFFHSFFLIVCSIISVYRLLSRHKVCINMAQQCGFAFAFERLQIDTILYSLCTFTDLFSTIEKCLLKERRAYTQRQNYYTRTYHRHLHSYWKYTRIGKKRCTHKKKKTRHVCTLSRIRLVFGWIWESSSNGSEPSSMKNEWKKNTCVEAVEMMILPSNRLVYRCEGAILDIIWNMYTWFFRVYFGKRDRKM